MRQQIIALGGGGLSEEMEDPLLERYIVEQIKKPHPKVCFLGTAKGDAPENIVRFYKTFSRLECRCSHLSLFDPPSHLEDFIFSQDAFYVGGGNTYTLLAVWKAWKLDLFLKKALERGILLSGFSAGSLCWFEAGLSDYMKGTLQPLKGLGFLKGSHCPHYNNALFRRPTYQKCIAEGALMEGVAADDGVALHYMDGELHAVLATDHIGAAYQVKQSGNTYSEEKLPSRLLTVIAN